MTDFIVYCAFVIVALLPILQRLYIQGFWIRGSGTVIRLEGGISTNPGAGGAWVWSPVIEYQAAGQRFSSRFSYWQLLNAKPKYKIGDQVGILYKPRNPSRFVLDSLDSWINYIVITIFLGSLVVVPALASRSPG